MCSPQLLHRLRPTLPHQVEQRERPVAAVTEPSQVGQRLFGTADNAFASRQLVAECDQQFAVALPLVGRQDQDAGHIVVLGRVFLLRKVADYVRALLVDFAQHIEVEGLHVKVERLVVEEQFGQQTQRLTVQDMVPAVNFVDRYCALSIDFRAGWLSFLTFVL